MGTAWPVALWATLVSYSDMALLSSGRAPTGYSNVGVFAYPLTGAVVLSVINAAVAGLLTLWSVKRLQSTWGKA